MDKASSAEEVAEIPAQEQPESFLKDKPQEEAEEKRPEEVPSGSEGKGDEAPASETKEVEEKRPEEVPMSDQRESPRDEASPKGDGSEGKEDIEYFPGEDLEASMDEVDNILGKLEPVKGDPGDKPEDKPEEVEPGAEDKEEEKVEDSSFEVIIEPPAAPQQELPTESDIEALGTKDLESVKEEPEEPEEKAELPLEEEIGEPPKEKAELSLEEEKIEEPPKEKAELPLEEEKIEEPPKEKAELPLEEEKIEETTEEKEEVKEEEEVPEPLSGTGIEFKEEGSEKPVPKQEEGKSFLAEEKESSEQASYDLDESPLEKGGAGLLEYFCLIGGLAVLGFLAYLLLKG